MIGGSRREVNTLLWNMAAKRGALVVLEGIDRSGKSTQCRKLQQALQAEGHATEVLQFPDRSTGIGGLISSYLKNTSNFDDHSVHLLFAANRWERVPHIKQKLQQGVTVIVDRYAFSGVAFTSAKPDFTLEWCKQPDIGIPKPDVILFLHLHPSMAVKRGGYGNERYENFAFQESVLEQFEDLMKDETLNWKKLDALQSVEDLHQEILSRVKKTISKVGEEPIGELWK